MIPYGHQDINQADIDAVTEVLRADFITQGPVVPGFEAAVAARVKVRHAIAVNSGTSALHIACLALDLGPGDLLWTVPNTFVASANCARYCGADVDFVDIDPLSWNMSVPRLKEKLVRAKKETRLPKVVVPVHFAGLPTAQEAIRDLSLEFGFKVLEDAAHAIGASNNGEPVGSCRWSDISVFSFHPVKIITTAEGGMALTNDDELGERMAMLRTHGITRDPARLQHLDHEAGSTLEDRGQPAPWYYEQEMLGFNYRMTDIQAALGRSQMRRIDEFIARRRALAARYDRQLADLPLLKPQRPSGMESAWHLYVVRLKLDQIRKSRRQIVDELRAAGVGANVHYIPVHTQPYYQRLGFKTGDFPDAERHYSEAISLPLYPGMTEAEQDQVVTALRNSLR